MAIVLVDKIAPKNDAFTGLVHADQVIGGATGSTLKDETVHVTNVTQWEGSITHNNLDGLTTGDPHTQYLETDGTRNLSDSWDLGSFRIGSLSLPLVGMDVANKEYVDAQTGGGYSGLGVAGIALSGGTYVGGSVTLLGSTNITIERSGSNFAFVGAAGAGGYSGLGVETFGLSGGTALSGAITIYPGTSTSIIRGGSNFTFNVSGILTNNIIGSVTGDVVGDLTGNITGSVLGDVTGNITGSLVGDVTGDLTGNVTGSSTIVDILGSGCVALDHGGSEIAQVINVCYGTGSVPPTASSTTEGTLYCQYTA